MEQIKKQIKRLPLLIFVIFLVIVWFCIKQANSSFDESMLSVDNIYSHIEELSSEKYNGSMAGTDGNDMAMDYISSYFEQIGIEPAGVDSTYYQPFIMMIPDIDNEPIFTINSLDENNAKEFIMYEDYNIVSSYNSSGIDFYGEIIVSNRGVNRIDPSLIKDKVVIIEANVLRQEYIDYVYQNGGKGIFCSVDSNNYGKDYRYEQQKSLNLGNKSSETIMVGFISEETYMYIHANYEEQSLGDNSEKLRVIPDVRIKAQLEYPIVNTANVLGKIDGKSSSDEVLIVSSNIDSSGAGIDGNYFPGAVSTCSGTAVMLEIARIMSEQDNLPYKSVLFIGFNGQQQGLSGTDYYVENPLYPFEDCTAVHLQNVGLETREGLKISSDNLVSSIMKSNVSNYAIDSGTTIMQEGSVYSSAKIFSDKNVPAVLLTDNFNYINSYNDTIENINLDYLENVSKAVLEYIKRDVYKDSGFDYLNITEKMIYGLLFLMLMFIYILDNMNKNNPSMKIGKKTVEEIFYLKPIIIMRKSLGIIVTVFLSVFLLALLANISPSTNIQTINGRIMTNLSGYITIKQSLLFISSIFRISTYTSGTLKEMLGVIFKSTYRSVLFLASAMILSAAFGIAKGMIDGYRSKNSSIRSFNTLVAFSIPDVLIVLFALMVNVFFAQKLPAVKRILPIKEVILPLISLSIIPSIYITRITFVTVQEEIEKEYIKHAKAQGQSRYKIFIHQILPMVVFKITDTMPTIMAMLLSNMIVVEYLFNYYGIVHYLLYFYNRGNTDNFVALAITLGLIYTLFNFGISLLSRLINPMKRRGES